MYSLSTCWNSHRHTDGRALLREVRELGFEYAELSHGTRISLLPGILEAVGAGEMKISTLHNFCPLPMGVNHAAPNLYQFTAESDRERESALKHTLKTLEFATRVKAPLVVLHLGSVELKDYSGRLKEMLERGEKDSPKYKKIVAEVIDKRKAKQGKFVERLYASLRKIIPEAEARGIRLGCENREALEELPFEDDFALLFRELSSSAMTYWHDTGHAQIKEHLGFIQHAQHLQTYAERLAGFHIHDVQPPARDHCAPGSGSVNFAALKPVVKPQHIKVFEFSPAMPVEELKRGVEHVKRIWGA
jgi:sugar phosphate isomerase/epimerase